MLLSVAHFSTSPLILKILGLTKLSRKQADSAAFLFHCKVCLFTNKKPFLILLKLIFLFIAVNFTDTLSFCAFNNFKFSSVFVVQKKIIEKYSILVLSRNICQVRKITVLRMICRKNLSFRFIFFCIKLNQIIVVKIAN